MFKEDWDVIKKLVSIFETKKIHYHFDASTAVFVHGIEFEMDDIDIVFMWHEEDKLREVFKNYMVSETEYVKEVGLKYFWTKVDEKKIHCLFYGNDDVIVTEKEFNVNTVIIDVAGQNVMTQSLEFYLKHSKDKNNLKSRIQEWLYLKEVY